MKKISILLATFLAIVSFGCATTGTDQDVARIMVKAATLELVQDDPELALDVIEAAGTALQFSESLLLLQEFILASLPEDLEPSDRLLAEELVTLIIDTIHDKAFELGDTQEAVELVLGWVRDAALLAAPEEE